MATRLLSRLWNRFFGGSGQLLDATRNGADSNAPDWPREPRDAIQDIPYRDYRTTMAYSRRLFANLDILKTASKQKSDHVVGRAWSPLFRGGSGNKAALAWGERAAHWLEHFWYPLCDVEGRGDFRAWLALDSEIIDRDGESPMAFVEDEEGWPLLQRIGAHRIACISNRAETVGDEAITYVKGEWVKGLYKGLRIEQGIIYNDDNRAVAARVMRRNQGEEPQDISLRDLDICGELEYADQGRCLPAIAGSINFFASFLKCHGYEMQALEIAGSIVLIERNAAGGADTSDPSVINGPASTTTGSRKRVVEKQDGGSKLYFRSDDPNAGIEAFRNAARPGAEWDSLNDRVLRIGVSRIFPYGLVWKPENANGTFDRTLIETARAMIKRRQDLLRPRAERAVARAVCVAMKIGILDEYPGEDPGGFMKWGFEMPEEFSIDHGREDEQTLKMYLAGFSTAQQYLDANALGTYEALCLARAREAATRIKTRKQVEQEEGVQIDPREMQMLGPNDQPKDAQGGQDAGDGNAPATNLDDTVKGSDDDEHDPHI